MIRETIVDYNPKRRMDIGVLECTTCGKTLEFGLDNYDYWEFGKEELAIKNFMYAHEHIPPKPPKPLKNFEKRRILIQMKHRSGAHKIL